LKRAEPACQINHSRGDAPDSVDFLCRSLRLDFLMRWICTSAEVSDQNRSLAFRLFIPLSCQSLKGLLELT
jgi:hypothetical protein